MNTMHPATSSALSAAITGLIIGLGAKFLPSAFTNDMIGYYTILIGSLAGGLLWITSFYVKKIFGIDIDLNGDGQADIGNASAPKIAMPLRPTTEGTSK